MKGEAIAGENGGMWEIQHMWTNFLAYMQNTMCNGKSKLFILPHYQNQEPAKGPVKAKTLTQAAHTLVKFQNVHSMWICRLPCGWHHSIS